MKCFICGVVEMVYDICDLFYIYKGESMIIVVVIVDFCLVCGEFIIDFIEFFCVFVEMLVFNWEVNVICIELVEIVEICVVLKFS